jgi:uncharacterized membrane protein
MMDNPKDFINEKEKKLIIEAIDLIESKTTGKIKIYVGKKSGANPLMNARKIFENFGMRGLKDKNGVIFFVTIRDKKLAIFGDDGINSKVGEIFWKNMKDAIVEKFKNNQFATGLLGGINLLGEKMMEFYFQETENPDGKTDDENSVFVEE